MFSSNSMYPCRRILVCYNKSIITVNEHIALHILESSRPYCSRIQSLRQKKQPHRRCLPLTGSEGNATMLIPTVHESNYCSHHPHRRLTGQGVFLRFSQWWRTQPQSKIFRELEKSLTHIQKESILM